jgi:RimJ/RimL family protein N-acetyltransferase
MHKLSLSVFPHNEAAIALYRKFGFEEEGYRRKQMRRASGELGISSKWGCCWTSRSGAAPGSVRASASQDA